MPERLVRTIDHVAVAVRDAEKALSLYVEVLGGRFILGGDNDETGNRIIQLALGGFKLELMQPLRSGSLLATTIDRRGEGFHHVTFVVDDLGRTTETLTAADVELRGTDLSNPNWRETFVHPGDAGGALLQLVTTDRDWSGPVDGIGLDDVLRGRVRFREAWPCWRPGGTADDERSSAVRSAPGEDKPSPNLPEPARTTRNHPGHPDLPKGATHDPSAGPSGDQELRQAVRRRGLGRTVQ